MSYGKKAKIRGFTLIEVLIVVAIMGMLLLTLSKLTSDGIKVYKRGIVQTEMKNQIRKTMDQITSDLRQADVGSGWVTPARTTDTIAPKSELEFRRYVYDSNAASTPTPATVKYVFEEEPGNTGYYMLTREINEGGVLRFGILADGLKFTKNSESGSYFKWKTDGMDSSKADLNSLLVVLVMEKYSGNIREEIKVQTAVVIRSEELQNPEVGGILPNYAAKYGVFMDDPSSLIDPREDY